MSNNFTDKAEKVLNSAVKIAENYGHTYIGSEHILKALSEDELSCSYVILSKCGVNSKSIDAAIREYSGTGSRSTLSPKDMTPRCRKIVENSYKNSIKFSSSKIGTEHILLAVLEEKDSVANRILDFLGTDTVALKDEVLTFLRTTEKSAEVFDKKNSGLPFLTQYGRNLNKLAKQNKFDPVIGRGSETERLIRILSRRTKNNPCLIGEAGVGKTAIVEGLAQRIVKGEVPELLKDKQVYSIDLTSMVAGAKYRGDFEERIKSIIAEASSHPFVILFIDEIHTIVGAGAAEGAIDAANILKPELSRGMIQLIGATTLSEYHKYIEKDPALERRFQPLMVEETDAEATVNILKNLKDRYEKHHRVYISDEAIYLAVKLAERYIQDRKLPDKAIDVIDEACAKASVKNCVTSDNCGKNDQKQQQNMFMLNTPETNEELEAALKIHKYTESYANCSNATEYRPTVSADDIKEIITEMTGIPISGVREEDNYADLELRLMKRVIGQDEAVKLLSDAVLRGAVGINNPKRPRGTFLFIGESGVGKTELAKAMCDAIFYSEKSLIRFDMSEFLEKHSISKLIGSPPGYVGYEEGGVLTEKVRRHPYSVILFDEIEKASDEVLNLLLQIMDDGALTDSTGRRVDFKNTFIIMTSNVGSDNLKRVGRLGFFEDGVNSAVTKLNDALKERFRPEFINRIDEIIPFRPLDVKTLEKIAEKNLLGLKSRLNSIGVEFDFSDGVLFYLANKGKVSGFGARPISRLITTEIENVISKILMRDKSRSIYISVDGDGKNIVFKSKDVTSANV